MSRCRSQGPPIAIEPIIQKDEGDCALACLAMLAGRPYVDVRRVARRLFPTAPVEGTSADELVRIGRALKYPLQACTLFGPETLEERTGILMIERKVKRRYHRHMVVLFEGVIIEPSDGTVWDFDAYMAELNWVPTVFVEPR